MRLLAIAPRALCKPTYVLATKADDGTPIRTLRVRGTNESATYLGDRYCELAFDYYRLFDRAFEGTNDTRRILMLGGGAYAWPKHVIATRPDAHLDVVELDPEVTRLARRWFYLDRLFEDFDLAATGRLAIHHADATDFLREAGEKGLGPWDAIVNDCFRGGLPVWDLLTPDVLAAAHALLAPGGRYLVNVVASLEEPGIEPLRQTVAALADVWAHVHVVPTTLADFERRQNVLVVATDADASFEGELAGLA